MARWLLLRRIAGLEKHGARPRPHQRGFLDGKTRGRRIRRHGETHGLGKTDDREKDAISDRPRGKSNSQYRTGQVPGGGGGGRGTSKRKKATRYCVDASRAASPAESRWEKLDRGKKSSWEPPRRGQTGLCHWSLELGWSDDGWIKMEKDPWSWTGSTGGLWSCSLPFRVGSGHWAPSLSSPTILRRRTRQLVVGASPVHLKSRKAHLFSGGPWTASVKTNCRAFSSFGPSFPAVWSSSLLTSSPPPCGNLHLRIIRRFDAPSWPATNAIMQLSSARRVCLVRSGPPKAEILQMVGIRINPHKQCSHHPHGDQPWEFDGGCIRHGADAAAFFSSPPEESLRAATGPLHP